MALTQRFLTVASSSVAALALSGCLATTGGNTALPEYRSVDAGTRTAGTPTDTQGARYYPNGEPVGINYNACRDLQTATRNVNNNRTVERSIDQGARNVGRAANTQRGRSNIGDIITGAAAGVGAAIAGQQINNALKTPQIARLEADCQQQKVRQAWEAEQKAAARSAGRAGANDARAADKLINDCVRSETRNGKAYTQALPDCRAAILAPTPR